VPPEVFPPDPPEKKGKPKEKLPPEVVPPVVDPPAPPEVPPPALGARVERNLPGSIDRLAVGGAGRYLVLHLPAQRQLAGLDVTQARIVHYISAAEDNVKFAAGQEKLVVVFPDTRVIQRWDLTTGKRELAIPLVAEGGARGVAMGSASHGPILLGSSLYDLNT